MCARLQAFVLFDDIFPSKKLPDGVTVIENGKYRSEVIVPTPVIKLADGTKSELQVVRSKASYLQRGVMAKLPGEWAGMTGKLSIRIVDATGVPDDVQPVVKVRLVAKHLHHGGHHVSKISTMADYEVVQTRGDRNGDEIPAIFTWVDNAEQNTLEFQIDEHTANFEITMYDLSTFQTYNVPTVPQIDLFDLFYKLSVL